MREIHARKNADYSRAPEGGSAYSNFLFASTVAQGFTNPMDRVFATLVGIKLARIQELTRPGRAPQNESLEDSFLDLAVYTALWASYRT